MDRKVRTIVLFAFSACGIIALVIWYVLLMDDQAHSKYRQMHAAAINGEILRIRPSSGGVVVRIKDDPVLYYFVPKSIAESEGTIFDFEADPRDSLVKKSYNDTVVLITGGRRLKYIYVRM